MRACNRPGNVCNDKLCAINAHNPEVGVQRGKRVSWPRSGARIRCWPLEERRFPGNWADPASGIGDQFQAPANDPFPTPGCPVIGCGAALLWPIFEAQVPQAAIGALGDAPLGAGPVRLYPR